MKNRILYLFILLLVLLPVSGCDMFRSIAGRPTSAELSAIRAEISAREAADMARRDSIEKAQTHLRDSIAAAEAALDSMARMKGLLHDPSKLGGLASSVTLDSRYYAVLGSFKEKSNAVKFMDKIKNGGYPAELIAFRTGFIAVGACPSNDPAVFLEQFGRIKKESFASKDIWILVNE